MQYRYTGPLTALTLKTETGPRELVLHPNCEVNLPEGNAHVAALVAQGYLASEDPAPRTRKPTKEEAVDGR
jgi:hypothetical protein